LLADTISGWQISHSHYQETSKMISGRLKKQLQLICLALLCAVAVPVAAQQPKKTAAHIPTPSEFLGFQVGADRKLADYRQIVSYFKALDAASDRMEIETLGKTTLGEEMTMAVISSEENLRNKSKYQEIARKLADPRGLTQEEIHSLAAEGKAIL